MGKIIQLVPHARSRDAIGKMVYALHHHFKKHGFASVILTEKQQTPLGWGPLRKGLLEKEPWRTYPPDATLVYHHSVGTLVANRFIDWPGEKKILVYHNITPPELISESPSSAKDARWGLDQLTKLMSITQRQVGLSTVSCQDLQKMGGSGVVSIPYLLRERRAWLTAARKTPTVLIVGRLVRHKRVLEAIRAFHELHRQNPSTRLVIVGNRKSDKTYTDTLLRFVDENQLSKVVSLKGKVSQVQLDYLYRRASVLLTLSAHEGFCVPLLEAMRADLPVVAYQGSAIPETLGLGGILVNSIEPGPVAEALLRAIYHKEVRQALIRNQAVERQRFAERPTAQSYIELVSTVSQD